MRSTASSGSPVQMKRDAACSSSSSSARRASSRGSSTPCLASAGSASGAQKRQSATAVARSAAYESLISIMRSIAAGSGPASRCAGVGVGQQALGVELARLARRRDQPALGAGEARALRPAGRDPDRDRLGRLVVDRRAARAVPACPRSARGRTSRARGSGRPPRAGARAARPRPAIRCRSARPRSSPRPEPSPRKMRPGARQPSVANACATTAGW